MAEQHLRKNIEAISSSRNKLKNLLKMCHLFYIIKLSLLLGEEKNVRFKSVSTQRLT